MDIAVDDAFGGDAARLFGCGRHALFAQDLDRLVHVAVRFGQRLFAVHHAYARLLAQRVNVTCCDCHFRVLSYDEFPPQLLGVCRGLGRSFLFGGSDLFDRLLARLFGGLLHLGVDRLALVRPR